MYYSSYQGEEKKIPEGSISDTEILSLFEEEENVSTDMLKAEVSNTRCFSREPNAIANSLKNLIQRHASLSEDQKKYKPVTDLLTVNPAGNIISSDPLTTIQFQNPSSGQLQNIGTKLLVIYFDQAKNKYCYMRSTGIQSVTGIDFSLPSVQPVNATSFFFFVSQKISNERRIWLYEVKDVVLTDTQCQTDADCREISCPSSGFVHEVCENNVCVLQSPCPGDQQCVRLGGAGPNGSLGPNDPNKDKKCCSGLKLITPLSATRLLQDGTCELADGAGSRCAACGDGTCDPTYENKCNCLQDCAN